MFIRVRSVLGEDVYVNADHIVTVQPAWRFGRDGKRTDIVGAMLHLNGDFNVQVHESPAQIIDLIDRAREAY